MWNVSDHSSLSCAARLDLKYDRRCASAQLVVLPVLRLFIDVLRSEGVAVRASGLRAPTATLPEKESYDKLPRVAVYKSPPLSEALKVVLKVSHNLYASMLPLMLAVRHDKQTLAEGMRLQGDTLAKLGVDVKDISLESGAGRRQQRPCHAGGDGATSFGPVQATGLAPVQSSAADSRRGRHTRGGCRPGQPGARQSHR